MHSQQFSSYARRLIGRSAGVLGCLFLMAALVQAEQRTLDDIARADRAELGDASQGESDAVEPFNTRDLAKQRPIMRLFCSRLELDQRRIEFSGMVAQLADADLTCRACKPFARILGGSCGGGKVPREFAKDQHGRPQREPHVLVVSALGDLFSGIAKDEASREDFADVVRRFGLILSANKALSPAAKEYFEQIYEVMQQPFQDLLRTSHGAESLSARSESPKIDSATKEKMLNDLF